MPDIRAIWTAQSKTACTTSVLPDGCRDLICLEQRASAPRWFLSPLQANARVVQIDAGTRMTGFRLQAGVHLDQAMMRLLAGRAPDRAQISNLVAENVRLPPDTAEALACLAQASSVAQGAQALGVSMRSLQRLIMRDTGKSPAFWLQLARLRRAGRLVCEMPLVETAYEAGYADQAHMSRAFRRWFGCSPAAFRTRPDLVAQVFSRAYG